MGCRPDNIHTRHLHNLDIFVVRTKGKKNRPGKGLLGNVEVEYLGKFVL